MSILFAPLTFRLVRGTTWLQTVNLTDRSSGDPVSLVGCALTMRVRRSINSSSVLMELSTTNGRLSITDAAAGQFEVLVDAADTLDFPENRNQRARYVYDLIIDRTSPARREPAISGKVRVDPQVTRLT